MKTIRDFFIKGVSDNNGNLNKANFEKIFVDNKMSIKRPAFTSNIDQFKGLKIALNDTWGHRSSVVKYEFNQITKECQATLRYRIFDHFGLDVDDIESFGSKQKILNKLGVLGPIVDGLTMPRDERGFPLMDQSAASSIAEKAAHGFCAWFILQHLRGYKPFITIMEKEETLKFNV